MSAMNISRCCGIGGIQNDLLYTKQIVAELLDTKGKSDMITAWMRGNPHTVLPYLVPSTQVAVRTTSTVVTHPSPATCVKGINRLACRLGSVRFALSPRNSDGDDRAASPGWGEAAPSKPLIGDLGYKRLTTFATRSRIGNKQRAITAVTLGACQRLSPDSETPNCNDPMREGLSLPFK